MAKYTVRDTRMSQNSATNTITLGIRVKGWRVWHKYELIGVQGLAMLNQLHRVDLP